MKTEELMMSSLLFQNFSNFIYWRVELNLFDQNGLQSANATSYFRVNQPPKDGSCTIDQSSGLSLEY